MSGVISASWSDYISPSSASRQVPVLYLCATGILFIASRGFALHAGPSDAFKVGSILLASDSQLLVVFVRAHAVKTNGVAEVIILGTHTCHKYRTIRGLIPWAENGAGLRPIVYRASITPVLWYNSPTGYPRQTDADCASAAREAAQRQTNHAECACAPRGFIRWSPARSPPPSLPVKIYTQCRVQSK